MYRRFKHVLHVLTRFDTDGFNFGAFIANHHLLLPFALDEDQAVDIVAAALIGYETFDFHSDGVRQLSTEKTHQFFTDDLGGHKALGTIGNIIFREVMDRFRQMLTHDRRDSIDVGAGFRRDRHNVEEVHLAGEELQVRQ